jgi:serine acetyltransferase
MNWLAKTRRGEGPVWGRVKRSVKRVLALHIPVTGPLRAMFGMLYQLHVCSRELMIWAARFFWFEPVFRSQCESIGPGFQMESLPYLRGNGRIVIGSGVRLSGMSTICFSTRVAMLPEFRIGDGTFIGHQCAFSIGRAIQIGTNCLLAANVRILDMDGHPTDADARRNGDPTPAHAIRPVTIGNDVWVGASSIILKGVSIGDRAIVAAGSVVTRSVSPDTVVAGNPATVVKSLIRDAGNPSTPEWIDRLAPAGAIEAMGSAAGAPMSQSGQG